MKLTIIIPVYNEEKTLGKIVGKLQEVDFGNVKKEIIFINDGSKDRSQEIINDLVEENEDMFCIIHEVNQGKGAAIREGIKNSSGDIITIQDGDLEYNPQDFRKLIQPIIKKKTKVVYGSRLMGNISGFNISTHYFGNKFLSFVTRILYKQNITDMETCYKVIEGDLARSLNLKSNRFDIEPEITAKIIKKKFKILEMPIDYNCRSFEEGKKITWKDGIIAIYTLFRYRFSR